jgi:hypothetical protein
MGSYPEDWLTNSARQRRISIVQQTVSRIVRAGMLFSRWRAILVAVDKSTLHPSDVLRKLHAKFSANFDQAIVSCVPDLERIDIKARALAECGSELGKMPGLTPSQAHLSSAAEEVFADLITSAYLSSIGLDRAAQMVLRRSLELGVAIVYLWDPPHLFWGWKQCDYDLSFSEMLEHLDSINYRTFLEKTADVSADDVLIDKAAAKRVYRTASNTVHGKITTHKVLAADGFIHDPDQCKTHMRMIVEVSTLLVDLWFKRFAHLEPAVRKALPCYDRV